VSRWRSSETFRSRGERRASITQASTRTAASSTSLTSATRHSTSSTSTPSTSSRSSRGSPTFTAWPWPRIEVACTQPPPGDNELVTIDSATNLLIARTPTGDFPDGVAYDPDHALLYVSDKNAGSITVVSADTGKVTDTIKVAEETGNVAYDSAARLVYAAARTPDALVAIDPTSSKITSRIRLPGCNGAHGVSIEAATNRAFVACERNGRLVTVDLTRRTETARSPVGRGPDVRAYDTSLWRLYVAAESGDVAVFALSSRTPKKLGQSHVADAAHSVAVD
jgi:DNA-binding beta-propeller fold protein YncE